MSRHSIGALRHRVALEAAQRTADGGGGASVTWLPVADVWASVEPVGGSEIVVAEAVGGRITHEVVLRYRPGLVPAMRIRFGSRHLEIAAVIDVGERRRHLKCLCRESFL